MQRWWWWWFLFIGVVVCISAPMTVAAVAQGIPRSERDPDPLHFLQTVAPLHLQPFHHVEVGIQEETTSEYYQSRRKSLVTAIVAPDQHYWYDTRGMGFSWLQVSDGTTEWTHDREHNRYMEQPVSANSPFQFRDEWGYEQGKLNDTHEVLKELADMPRRLRNAAYLPDETITVDGQPIVCIVIDGEGKFRPGWSPDIHYRLRFWVDRQTRLIRQVRERMEGMLTRGGPHEIRETIRTYTKMEFGPRVLDPGLFVFHPPVNASMVKTFPAVSQTVVPRSAHLVGKTVPDLTLHAANGASVSLRSLVGKPLLIEMWATWCAPCVESVPTMIKLNAEAAPKGLAMVAIDEDDEPERVRNFLAKHNPPWPNFHDDGEAARALAGDGIPQFVLIDAGGIVRFAHSGFDEADLRAAIARLGPDFASLDTRPPSKP